MKKGLAKLEELREKGLKKIPMVSVPKEAWAEGSGKSVKGDVVYFKNEIRKSIESFDAKFTEILEKAMLDPSPWEGEVLRIWKVFTFIRGRMESILDFLDKNPPFKEIEEYIRKTFKGKNSFLEGEF